jgi:hypothetical protein
MVMRKKNIKVYGIGVNDSPTPVSKSEKVNGKWRTVWVCPYYAIWKGVLQRCYSDLCLKKYPTYRGCSICPEWIYFMTFKAWMMAQDWEGRQLDKDILVEGNKIYSPETCRFVEAIVNAFLNDQGVTRGEWPIGVHWNKAASKFQALCRNPFTKRQEYLGSFTCPNEAHEAWRKRKHEHACALADLQTDPDIAEALRLRFKPKEAV